MKHLTYRGSPNNSLLDLIFLMQYTSLLTHNKSPLRSGVIGNTLGFDPSVPSSNLGFSAIDLLETQIEFEVMPSWRNWQTRPV